MINCNVFYLERSFRFSKVELIKKLKGQKISVIFDKTPDLEERCVLNILLALMRKTGEGQIPVYVADTIFLNEYNHLTISQSVIATLRDFSIAFNDVVSFNTDSAAYMVKAFKSILSPLYPMAVHITCMAHILNLIGDSFRKPFELLSTFMLCFSRIFYMAGGRKRRYLKHLADEKCKVVMAPDPCGTRWCSWFLAICYTIRNILQCSTL